MFFDVEKTTKVYYKYYKRFYDIITLQKGGSYVSLRKKCFT